MDENDDKKKSKDTHDPEMSEIVGKKAERKLKAKKNKIKTIWFGFSVFGLVGWSVALPCLLGAGLGLWLDEHYPREQSWTLILLLAGLTIGIFNAWRWVEIERQKIIKTKDDDND